MTFDSSFGLLRVHEEGQLMKDDEATIEHKVNEVRMNMYYDPNVGAIFCVSQDSVIVKEEKVPSPSSFEDLIATSGHSPSSELVCLQF